MVRYAYADPPYPGKARKHYGPDAKEVNFPLLIAHLTSFDGAALSCNSTNLRDLLPLCPKETRVAPWCKPFAVFKPGVNPGYCWEPVLFWGSRKRDRYEPTVRDFLVHSITLGKGTVGAKPEAFCRWVFDLLNLRPEDTLVDLFPGSGVVSRQWFLRKYQPSIDAFVADDSQPPLMVLP